MNYIEKNFSLADATLYSRRYAGAYSHAEVVLVHGFGEHSGRYEPLITHLLENEYAVTAYDHRGHGKSSGLYGHIDRFRQYEEDLHAIVSDVCGAHAGQKLFLIGHSMGGLVALRYLTRFGDSVTGAVISAPLVEIAAKVPAHKLFIGKIGAAIAPRLRLANEINPMILSRDPEVGRAYAADPLVGKLVSTRWFVEASKAMAEFKREAMRIRTPLLVMHGTEDRLASPQATKEVFEKFAANDKELKIYEGYYHELFNEPEKQEVFARVTDWLNRHCENDSAD